jgi:hypothetical protein
MIPAEAFPFLSALLPAFATTWVYVKHAETKMIPRSRGIRKEYPSISGDSVRGTATIKIPTGATADITVKNPYGTQTVSFHDYSRGEEGHPFATAQVDGYGVFVLHRGDNRSIDLDVEAVSMVAHYQGSDADEQLHKGRWLRRESQRRK